MKNSYNNFTSRNRIHGFTIVELLVVIMVIGILATISIVSYTGISNRAIIASIQSDLTNASEQLKIFRISNSAYPNSITDCPTPAASNVCLTPSSGNVYANYVRDNTITPQGFCINMTNGANSYKITSTKYKAPIVGACIAIPPPPPPYTTPGTYSWTAPSGLTSMQIQACGAQGGKGGDASGDEGLFAPGGNGGNGGCSNGTLAVSAGNVFSIVVGSKGTLGIDVGCYVDSGNVGWSYADSGTAGQESYLKLGTTYEARGYGGAGGSGAGAYVIGVQYGSDCTNVSNGATGSAGSGVVNTTISPIPTATTIQSGQQANNGKVVIDYPYQVEF